MERVRLHESDKQIQAMRKGLSTVVPESLLQLMTWQDLEWRVCGRPYVDVGLLRRHTEYSGMLNFFFLGVVFLPSRFLYLILCSGSIARCCTHWILVANSARVRTTRPEEILTICMGSREAPS